mmetsp:Transcript_7265/g.22019  ORF Transcript_7265/g.22019 Transcript_7265/m.22019 type:complete len:278 (-) Transcript_7265:151-984(-)
MASASCPLSATKASSSFANWSKRSFHFSQFETAYSSSSSRSFFVLLLLVLLLVKIFDVLLPFFSAFPSVFTFTDPPDVDALASASFNSSSKSDASNGWRTRIVCFSSSSSFSSLSLSSLFSSSLETGFVFVAFVAFFAFATAAAVAGFTLRLATPLFFCSLFAPASSSFFPSGSLRRTLFLSSSASASASFSPPLLKDTDEKSPSESSSNANLASRFLSLLVDLRATLLFSSLPFDSFGRDATGVVHETIFAKFDMSSPLRKNVGRFLFPFCRKNRW